MNPLVEKYIPEQLRNDFVADGYWLNRTMRDYFDTTVSRYSQKEAIVCGEQRITFEEWAERADGLAGGLLALGIGLGDVVSVQLPNWPEFCYLQVALGKIGAVMSPLHMVYRERELLSMLRFCQSKVLVIADEYKGFDYVKAIQAIWSELPDLKQVIVLGKGTPERMVSFQDILSHDSQDGRQRLESVSFDADELLYLNFTSGTEGMPKGFLHTHNSLISCCYHATRLEGDADEVLSQKTILAHGPMTHTFGHMMPYEAIVNGAKVVMVEAYDPGEALKLVDREKITSMSGTPAHFIGFLNHKDYEKYDLSSLKDVGVGGAPCPVQLIRELQEKIGCRVANTYGMGETLGHTITRTEDDPETIFETVGRALPGSEVAIFDDSHSQDLGLNQVGEIAYRGPNLFICYHRHPERTEETRNAEGWFFTGDLGQVDDKGYLRLTGRKKDVINRGGTKIFPDDIEDILHQHPKILKVAAVGMPDYRMGEKVCAYIIPRENETVTMEDVVAFMESQKVMKYKIPERIEVVQEFPMLPSGKIRKESLRQDIAGKVGQEPQG